MTERSTRGLRRQAQHLQIGPSQLRWAPDGLHIDLDEWTFPWPRRVRGHIHVHPRALPGPGLRPRCPGAAPVAADQSVGARARRPDRTTAAMGGAGLSGCQPRQPSARAGLQGLGVVASLPSRPRQRGGVRGAGPRRPHAHARTLGRARRTAAPPPRAGAQRVGTQRLGRQAQRAGLGPRSALVVCPRWRAVLSTPAPWCTRQDRKASAWVCTKASRCSASRKPGCRRCCRFACRGGQADPRQDGGPGSAGG